MTEENQQPQQPAGIEEIIARLVKQTVGETEKRKYGAMWNSYIYSRVAVALLEEARCGMTDMTLELLEIENEIFTPIRTNNPALLG